MKYMASRLPLLVVLILCALIAPANAQVGLRGLEGAASIVADPSDPMPGENVRLVVKSVVIDLARADITWTANGTVVAHGLGITEASVIAPAYGEETQVSASIDSDGAQATANATVAPRRLDLMYEADSYVPPFYRGRALPSAGTNVRLFALPHFRRADGTFVPENSISYTWRKNGTLLTSASGIGRSAAIVRGPELFGSDVYSVDVVSTDGGYAASASVTVRSVEPKLVLYQDSALFGLMYHWAFASPSFIHGSEMTFAAVPYFAQARSSDDKRLVYEWRVDGMNITADQVKRSEITVDAKEAPGPVTIELQVTHTDNIFMESKRSWGITFGTASLQNGGANPFFNNQ